MNNRFMGSLVAVAAVATGLLLATPHADAR